MASSKKNMPILKRSFNEDISPEDIDIQVNEPKDTLNKDLWENGKLKKEIRVAMLKIAKAFKEYLKLNVRVKDVVFTGSLANFNWTLMSDVDIHLILDLKSLGEPEEFMTEYISAKKNLWNDSHNIKIKNFEVELFAKGEETLLTSKGVYSVLGNVWIQKPEKYTKDIDEAAVKEKAASVMNEIDSLEQIGDDEEIIKKSEKINERIKKLRSSGLEQGGEYSIENLAFKTLRKAGYLDKLYDIKTKAVDSSLTLTEKNLTESLKSKKTLLKEGMEGIKKEYGCLMLDFNIKSWDKITDKIKSEDVYDKPGYGIEKRPHVTALFGFICDKTSPEEVSELTKKLFSNKLKIKVNGMSLFKNKDFDVLKFDIISPDLKKLNKALVEKFPYKNDYPDYTPHMTIAYLKPGTGEKYAKKLSKNIIFESNEFTYSYCPDKKIHFNLNGKENTLGIEKDIEGMTPERIEVIKNFINFVCNRLELQEPVSIYLHKGRDEYITTTASYVPDENSNHIRCTGRALVDILRSIAHELTHNRQREVKSFEIGENVPTIGGWIEDEANAKAGIMIKDFAMNFGFDEIYDV